MERFDNESAGDARDKAIAVEVTHEKLADAFTPGFWAVFAPDEAELAGAFVEDALDEADAVASDVDLIPPINTNAKE